MHGHSCVPRELDHLHADIALASASLRIPTLGASTPVFLDPRLRVADLRRQARDARAREPVIVATRGAGVASGRGVAEDLGACKAC